MAKATHRGISQRPSRSLVFADVASRLVQLGGNFYRRGWVLGTSGNFSAVLRRTPLRLAITVSGADKGTLVTDQIVEINEAGIVIRGKGQPSTEAPLHVTVVRAKAAGAVLHTHSVWSTILSEEFAALGGITISGYEMMKGLSAVTSHEHKERIPILENSQDISALARRVEQTLGAHPSAHGFLLKGHGLYTWGKDLAEASRHIEILEFLLEVLGWSHMWRPGVPSR